ncbi:MAG: hypothetical protein Harvfovirus11_24 [Harvfovirus sp.]|uniref:Uncharacterized protein n=1 Tax=Harvfovirus sp. TaxID=2487768 RepID=A0A3G5A1A0_9VIRU|nr:MAG: hypothetical protein Harvfovirus11_24 [Harvfovirus sp.]
MSFECNGGILLEPRLQEYIKKKLYYKKNKIEPNVNPEYEFCINEQDVKRLKAFLKGDTDLYNYKTQKKFDLDEGGEPGGFEFDPDEVYRSDVRYKRFAKKLKRDKEAMKQRHSYSDFADDYVNAFSEPDVQLWKDERIMNQRVEDERKMFGESVYKCKNPVNSRRTYGSGEVKQQKPRGVERAVVGKREGDLQCGQGTRGGKSLGYRNPSEHYFDYIDDDIQDANNVVFERARNTRSDNYGVARQYKRDIIN